MVKKISYPQNKISGDTLSSTVQNIILNILLIWKKNVQIEIVPIEIVLKKNYKYIWMNVIWMCFSLK